MTIRHCTSQRLLKEEDVLFEHGDGGYHLFAVSDGHHGRSCAAFIKENFWSCLKHRLPTIPPNGSDDDTFQILTEIRKAVLDAFMCVDEAWYKQKKHSGATLTVALIVGRLLTIANVGDSSAFFHDGQCLFQLSKDHRLDDSPAEKQRLMKANVQLAPLRASLSGPAEVGETGYGPLRVWPGGLAVSRSIGDADMTPHVLCVPHIRQLIIPWSGVRLVLASDGIWDALGLSQIKKAVKHKSLKKCPERLTDLVSLVKGGELEDDASVAIVDALATDEDFKNIVKARAKSNHQTRLKKLTKSLGRRKKPFQIFENYLADLDGVTMVPEHLLDRQHHAKEAPCVTTEDFTVFGKDTIRGILFTSVNGSSV